MINLLPAPAKKNLLIEYWIRVVSVWMVLWSVALIAATSVLLPTYVLIEAQVKSYADSAAAASEKVANYESVSVALVEASQQAKMVIDEEKIPLFSYYVNKFESLQQDGIVIKTINLTRADSGVAPILIGGEARDRQSLASFRDRLLADEAVDTVDLPISNLARDKNISFSITVTLVNQTSV